MSIFDSLFGHKKEEQKEDKVNLTKQIDTLVLVIENLGLLNKEKIIEKLDKLPVEYDKNLIKRLSISEDKEKLSALYKYLEKDNLSFGKESINSLRKQLEFISSNNSLTQDNMIEEMLNVTEKYINKYKNIIEELNNSIKTFEMAKPTYADKIAMIDSFTKLYKENELGYPINLEEKVEDRQRSLKNLKYGGYGEEELKSFISRCKNTITDKKNKGWTTKEILDFIDENIYTPLLSRYNQDLEQLEIRISRLQSGEYKENERKIKKDEIERLFKRKVNYLNTNNSLNYRNKVVLHIKNNKIGFYDSKTHNICSFNTCYLLDSLINKTIYNIKEYDLTGVYEIMIRSVNNEVMVNIISDIENTPLLNIDVDSLYLNDKYIKGKEYLIDEINKYKFSIYPLSFYQINNEGMTSIYNKAKEYILGGDTLLDLYCGTGTIGIWMSDIFRKVVGVEINESSIKNANINKKLNNINNIEFICSDAKRIKGKFDSIIVDPPRNGLSKEVINYINNSNSKRLVYISCNYKTLKRDIDLLSNYALKDISICDMFPRTKHVESVCMLEKL